MPAALYSSSAGGRSIPPRRPRYLSVSQTDISRQSINDGWHREALDDSAFKVNPGGCARPRRAARATAGPGVDADCVPLGRPSLRYQAPADAADRCRLIATRDRWSATTGRETTHDVMYATRMTDTARMQCTGTVINNPAQITDI